MTNYNDFLDNIEDDLEETLSDGTAFDLTLENRISQKQNTLRVFPNNTLGQIAELCPKLIGSKHFTNSDISETYTFEHSRTHDTTKDLSMTVAEFGLRPGDILLVYDDSSNG